MMIHDHTTALRAHDGNDDIWDIAFVELDRVEKTPQTNLIEGFVVAGNQFSRRIIRKGSS